MQRQNQTYEITEDHYNFFCQEVDRFVELFKLYNWEVSTIQEYLEDGGRAEIGLDFNGCIAGIRLNTEWEYCCPNEDELTKVAFHEVLHLLFADYHAVSICNLKSKIRRELVVREEHAIIRILENTVFPLINNNINHEDKRIILKWE